MTTAERYNRSEKGRARHRRYNKSGKGRARQARYEQTRIRVSFGGFTYSYRVPAARKEALIERLAELRSAQREQYRAEFGEDASGRQ